MKIKNMDYFDNMGDIVYDDYSQFIRNVDINRSNMLEADNSMLSEKTLTIININEDFELSNGRIEINFKGIQFECFFHYKPSSVLYVFLNGALTQRRPQFNRWSYYTFLDGSVLNIADPMYASYEDLILGWYYGNQDYNLREYVSELVKIIADKLGILYEHIVFYGSSGGGAAVIECASHIEGAMAVAINPQIVLSEYFYAEEFERITHNNLFEDNRWHRNNGIYYLQNNHTSKHIILMNIRCRTDMEQIENVCRAMNIKDLRYGFNRYGNLIIWLYDCECEPYIDAHNLQDNYCMCLAIEILIKKINKGESLRECSFLCKYTNEWWFEWWRHERYWRGRQPNLHCLMECIKMSRKVALFGTGADAQKLNEELLDINGENYYAVEAVFDNDVNKTGKDFNGIVIMKPDNMIDWLKYFIIISTLRYAMDIQQQLEAYGLAYKKDFINISDLYK